jgi:hypothetical protein
MGIIVFVVGLMMTLGGIYFVYTALFGSATSVLALNRPFDERKAAREVRTREVFGPLYVPRAAAAPHPRRSCFIRGVAMLVGGIVFSIPEVGHWLGYEHNPWF